MYNWGNATPKKNTLEVVKNHMDVTPKIVGENPPKSSHGLIGFSMKFSPSILGCFHPYF